MLEVMLCTYVLNLLCATYLLGSVTGLHDCTMLKNAWEWWAGEEIKKGKHFQCTKCHMTHLINAVWHPLRMKVPELCHVSVMLLDSEVLEPYGSMLAWGNVKRYGWVSGWCLKDEKRGNWHWQKEGGYGWIDDDGQVDVRGKSLVEKVFLRI